MITRRVRPIGWVLAVLTLLGGATAVWDLHRRTMLEAARNLNFAGEIIAGHISRYVEDIDLLLQRIEWRIPWCRPGRRRCGLSRGYARSVQ